MKPVRFNAKPNNIIKPCPRCGQNERFHAYSQQVCEDGCEVWITCICKCDPTDREKRAESVMGEINSTSIGMAIGSWNDSIKLEEPQDTKCPRCGCRERGGICQNYGCEGGR